MNTDLSPLAFVVVVMPGPGAVRGAHGTIPAIRQLMLVAERLGAEVRVEAVGSPSGVDKLAAPVIEMSARASVLFLVVQLDEQRMAVSGVVKLVPREMLDGMLDAAHLEPEKEKRPGESGS